MYEPINYLVVEEEELNRFVTEYYKLKTPFSCRANEGWKNDSVHRADVEKGQMDGDDVWKVKSLVGDPDTSVVQHFSVGSILRDLCDKGAIQPGHYLIEVCW